MARELAKCLEENGYEAWYDAAEVQPGERSADLRDAIVEASGVVVLVDGEADREQRDEWRRALEASWEDASLRIVPVVMGDAELPGWLRGIQAVEVPEGQPGHRWDPVLQALEEPTRRGADPTPEWRARLGDIVRYTESLEADVG